METILTDVDGVLLDWTGAFEKWISHKNLRTYGNLHNTSLETWLDISEDDACDLVHSFNNTEEFGMLPAFSDAMATLPLLAKKHQVIAITACDQSPESVERRTRNLEDYFPGVFSKVIHTGIRPSEGKRPYLNQYDDSYWVEDTLKHAIDGHHIGHETFLIDRYGRHKKQDGIKLVESWFQIHDLIS